MKKPKIIIIDEDINYILPIQEKLIEAFFDRIDLEIITDNEYFKTFFSSPQRIDILIISERFYSNSIQKHNINTIFVLTEKDIDSVLQCHNLISIYKYSSIKEIFDKIVSNSEVIYNNAALKKEKSQIILVYSASGGVGKTTISMGMSSVLSDKHKNVLYINACRLQYFQTFLSNPGIISSADIYSKLIIQNNNIYSIIKPEIKKENFNYIPPFMASLMSLNISYDIFEKVALSAKESNEYDYIIIDADNVLDEYKIRLIDISDKVIIVTKQDKISISATNYLVSNINSINNDKYLFICNDFKGTDEQKNNINNMDNQFSINEYVDSINECENLTVNELACNNNIQKLSYLIL